MTNAQMVYVEKLEAQLRELEAHIQQARAKAGIKAVEARAEFSEELDKHTETQAELRSQLKELKAGGDTAWANLQNSMSGAWENVNPSPISAAASTRQRSTSAAAPGACRATNSTAAWRIRPGRTPGPPYSSAVTWKLDPPKPKALTDARGGCSGPRTQGRARVVR